MPAGKSSCHSGWDELPGRNAVGAVAVVLLLGGVAFIVFMSFPRTPVAARSTSEKCVIIPTAVSLAEAKRTLDFPVYALGADARATLASSQYAEGCSGARGLDVESVLNASSIELVEASAPPAGSPLVRVKGGMTAQSGWSQPTISGQRVDVDVAPGGKGLPSGIEEAVWAEGPTMFTLTPQSSVPGGAPTPLTVDTVSEVIADLAPV